MDFPPEDSFLSFNFNKGRSQIAKLLLFSSKNKECSLILNLTSPVTKLLSVSQIALDVVYRAILDWAIYKYTTKNTQVYIKSKMHTHAFNRFHLIYQKLLKIKCSSKQ